MTRVLVVEDDPRIARFMVRGLTRGGFECERAETGEEALGAVLDREADPIGLVTLDLGLPDVPGLEVLRRMRAAGVRTPVVIVTAYRDEEARREALALGVTDYLVKPVPLRTLVDALGASAA